MDQQDHFSLPQNVIVMSAPPPGDMDAEPSHHSAVEACPAPVMTANTPTGAPHAQVQATADLVLPYNSAGPSTVEFEVPFEIQGYDYFEQGNRKQDGDDDVLGIIEQLQFSLEDCPDHPIVTWPKGPLNVKIGSMADPLPVNGQRISRSVPATQTVVQALNLMLNSKTPGTSPLPTSTQDPVSSRVVEWRFQALHEPSTHSRQRDADAT
ncbi:hypothetical protein DEU56DRAFT_920124 [Suillus clintonianus]|uniref:uncharacterized protein n=1 Tax=Suillus clintonianus TaxID=1904413 RepID=UPI001B8667C1|nr:uncharacterized protein DEU56DRAFT_920124 [Suillus clintonianus]KAG2110797.1 hypothetical protein DEU56DRAFT_920124 [Suillus clintonianus]